MMRRQTEQAQIPYLAPSLLPVAVEVALLQMTVILQMGQMAVLAAAAHTPPD
jgi:hypothetical protein